MWAPWRMRYITAEHTGGYEGPSCVFCDLPAQDDDAKTVDKKQPDPQPVTPPPIDKKS